GLAAELVQLAQVPGDFTVFVDVLGAAEGPGVTCEQHLRAARGNVESHRGTAGVADRDTARVDVPGLTTHRSFADRSPRCTNQPLQRAAARGGIGPQPVGDRKAAGVARDRGIDGRTLRWRDDGALIGPMRCPLESERIAVEVELASEHLTEVVDALRVCT